LRDACGRYARRKRIEDDVRGVCRRLHTRHYGDLSDVISFLEQRILRWNPSRLKVQCGLKGARMSRIRVACFTYWSWKSLAQNVRSVQRSKITFECNVGVYTRYTAVISRTLFLAQSSEVWDEVLFNQRH
jgi:hypothetical protein